MDFEYVISGAHSFTKLFSCFSFIPRFESAFTNAFYFLTSAKTFEISLKHPLAKLLWKFNVPLQYVRCTRKICILFTLVRAKTFPALLHRT